MARKKKIVPVKAKPGRKPIVRRKSYTIALKEKVRAWHLHDNLGATAVKRKLLVEHNLEVSLSTIVSWWSPKILAQIENIAPDRLNVQDTRINPIQRPDIVVDTERVLFRKVIANKGTGLPYTRTAMQVLAINIFNKLCTFNLYDKEGQRKQRDVEISENVMQAAQKPTVAHKYLARHSKKTEWHKSERVQRNIPTGKSVPKPCEHCPRIFKSSISLTLHCYWHTCRDNSKATVAEDADDLSDECYSSGEEEEYSDVDYRFVASPGWIKNFLYRYDLDNYKMKGEKGSADYDAIQPWITGWLKTLYADCALYNKTLPQLLTVIVNFDECGIQYKSIPQ